MNRTWTTAVAAGALCGLVAVVAESVSPSEALAAASTTQAHAQTAKKAKATAKPITTVKVTVTNSRPASLVELEAAVSGSAKMKKVLGSLKPGKQAIAIMPRGDNCQVDLHGAF